MPQTCHQGLSLEVQMGKWGWRQERKCQAVRMNRGENEIWRGRRGEDLVYCWNVKLKPLSLMPANWLSRLTGFLSAGKLPPLNQQKWSLCHLKWYIFILHETSSKHTNYLSQISLYWPKYIPGISIAATNVNRGCIKRAPQVSPLFYGAG